LPVARYCLLRIIYVSGKYRRTVFKITANSFPIGGMTQTI